MWDFGLEDSLPAIYHEFKKSTNLSWHQRHLLTLEWRAWEAEKLLKNKKKLKSSDFGGRLLNWRRKGPASRPRKVSLLVLLPPLHCIPIHCTRLYFWLIFLKIFFLGFLMWLSLYFPKHISPCVVVWPLHCILISDPLHPAHWLIFLYIYPTINSQYKCNQ